MGVTTDDAKELVDQLADQQQVLAAAQAKHATLMLEFSDARRRLDQSRITSMRGDGADPRYTAGEFAALEIGLAITASKHSVSRTIGIARRLKDETPDAWDAWQAGHIDQPRAARINKALLRLTRDSSKQLLNALVVDVAVCKTVELLGRWLSEFIARFEPDQTNERLRRSFEDRYVSIRPDIDGISFLNAAIASADADAINQVRGALAAIAEPGDTRTLQQRRADACTELLLGKISNGCHVTWQDDDEEADDEADDEPDANERGNGQNEPDDCGETLDATGDQAAEHEEHDPAGTTEPIAPVDSADTGSDDQGSPENDPAAAESGPDTDSTAADSSESGTPGDGPTVTEPTTNCDHPADHTESFDSDSDDDRPWDTDDDFDLPASAFRPDPHTPAPDTDPTGAAATGTAGTGTTAGGTTTGTTTGADERPNPYRKGRPVVTPCPHDHQNKPIPATIGVIISAQSLFGYSNTPGQLADRSSLIPADLIRDLAQQSGTLFYRLVTDEKGNLLDVTELGRFPSRKLGNAIDFRDGTCTTPICTTPAHRCDHDHVIPVPVGPTTASNLQNHCRPEHRAKTHAGHHTSRDGHTMTWTTPTGHTYRTTDQPFPVEQWPCQEKEPPDE